MTKTVTTTPTQVRRPWRSTIRTVVQLVLAVATLVPLVAAGVYVDLDQAPAIVGQVLAAAAVITRVMALPAVEAFLKQWAPWLAAEPTPKVYIDRTSESWTEQEPPGQHRLE